MENNGSVVVGILPSGECVSASVTLIAQIGAKKARYELVDRHWLRETGSAPGYFEIRTNPFTDDKVLIEAETHEEALLKYINSMKVGIPPTQIPT